MRNTTAWPRVSTLPGLPIGFDHRIGHFRPLRIIGTTPNSSALNGLGASTWDRSRWGGRRHDQGLPISVSFIVRASPVG
jgi:hypothetical protein